MIPAGLDVTVPLPMPVLVTVRMKRLSMKMALTDRRFVTVTVHVVPDTESHPVQPLKSESAPGAAVSVTVVLITKSLAHAVPQLMPAGLDVTVPLPVPVLVAVRVKRWSVKMALTDRAFAIVTVHVAPDTESHPVQPVNSESAAAVAVSVTCEELTNVPEHPAGQLMPAGADVTVPPPLP